MTDRAWGANPSDGTYNSTANWVGGVVPGAGDTAVFGPSSITDLVFNNGTGMDAWRFEPSAPPYSFTIAIAQFLVFNGAGIVNGDDATINNNNSLTFANSASLGSATVNNNSTGVNTGGVLGFLDTSTAGSASITNAFSVSFQEDSTAGVASITNNADAQFLNTSDAGSSAIINNDALNFKNQSTAQNATITTNNGATTSFLDNSTGGNARLITNAGGIVDFSGSGPSSDFVMSAGSIQGAGTFDLSFTSLRVGGNNLSTVVAGVITGNGGISAPVGAPFVKLGMNPGMAATYLLPNVVGEANARELLLTGRTVEAEEARRLGLVSRVFPADSFAAEVDDIAAGIAATAPIPSRYTKLALRDGGHRTSSRACSGRHSRSRSPWRPPTSRRASAPPGRSGPRSSGASEGQRPG